MKCKICGNSKFRKLFSKISYSKKYTLIRCESCGFITIKEYPSQKEINRFFIEGYDFNYMSVNNRRVNRIVKNRLDLLLRFKKTGKLLEVGCGSGIFLNEARKHFMITGLDKSREAARIGKKMFNLEIQPKDFYELKKGDRYDVIVLFHVLEHLLDPVSALKKLKYLMKENGVVFIIVPNNKSLSFRFFGKYWEWINPPKHLSYFDKKTISSLLKKEGFEIKTIKTQRGDDYNFLFNMFFLFLGLTGIRKSLGKPGRSKKGTKTFLFLYELVFDITNILVLPFYPLRWLLERIGLGSEMAIIARKRRGQ